MPAMMRDQAPTIRLANLADLDAVADLFDQYRQFYEQAPDPDLARQFIEQRLKRAESLILLAEVPQSDHADLANPTDRPAKPIGFCQLYPSFCSVEAKPIFVLYDLFVAPAARQAGVVRALLLAAEALARQQGKARMDLTTAKTNRAAQSVYESLGWVRDDVFYAYNRAIR